MATSTGKKARKAHGNRFACKRAKSRARTGRRRQFGKLPVSVVNGTAGPFVLAGVRREEA